MYKLTGPLVVLKLKEKSGNQLNIINDAPFHLSFPGIVREALENWGEFDNIFVLSAQVHVLRAGGHLVVEVGAAPRVVEPHLHHIQGWDLLYSRCKMINIFFSHFKCGIVACHWCWACIWLNCNCVLVGLWVCLFLDTIAENQDIDSPTQLQYCKLCFVESGGQNNSSSQYTVYWQK